VDALLDKDYRAALLHLEEVARAPARAPGEPEAARFKLFDAWGAANTPMRKYLVARHLAVVYGLLNDAEMVRRWLKTSFEQVQAEVSSQVSHLHSSVVGYLAGLQGEEGFYQRMRATSSRMYYGPRQAGPKPGVLIRFSQFVAAEFTLSGSENSPIANIIGAPSVSVPLC
jgi:hypothetical protein